MLPLKRVRAMSASSDDELDDFQIRFQQAHGARLFRQGKPRALLEVKSPNIPTAMYEARLRGYDGARTAKATTSQVRKKGLLISSASANASTMRTHGLVTVSIFPSLVPFHSRSKNGSICQKQGGHFLIQSDNLVRHGLKLLGLVGC